MTITTKDGAPAKFDEDGFLVDAALWDQELAQQIAREDGIGELSEAHWAILRELRDHYLKSGALLPASHACHMKHQNLDCVDGLFQSLRKAWRIAGLPNPGEEAKSYM